MSPSLPNDELNAARSLRTALVVDDVEDMLDLLEIALNCAQFTVLRAATIGDAIKLFEDRSADIDLLMTEVRVGAESGLDLARQLLDEKPSLQVLAISALARDRRLAGSKNGISFLPKPFSASELRKKLHSLFPVPAV